MEGTDSWCLQFLGLGKLGLEQSNLDFLHLAWPQDKSCAAKFASIVIPVLDLTSPSWLTMEGSQGRSAGVGEGWMHLFAFTICICLTDIGLQASFNGNCLLKSGADFYALV